MSIESTIDYVMRSLEKALYKVVPVENCPLKEEKNKWKRERIKEAISKNLMAVRPGPMQLK